MAARVRVRVRTRPVENLSRAEREYLRAAHERARRRMGRAIAGQTDLGEVGGAVDEVESAREAIARARRANRAAQRRQGRR